MASIEVRHHRNQPDTYRVRWRQDGIAQRHEESTEERARVFRALVEAAGHTWPQVATLYTYGFHELARERDVEGRLGMSDATLVDWCRMYVTTGTRADPLTVKKYGRNIDNHLVPFFGDMALTAVRGRDIARWQEWMMDPVNGLGLKPGTVIDTRAGVLAPALRVAARPDMDGAPALIPSNPVLSVRLPDQMVLRPEVWTQEELDEAIDIAYNMRDPRGGDVLATLAGTGARWSEVVAFSRPSFYPDRGIVEVRQHAVRRPNIGWVIEAGAKTKAGIRDVTLAPAVCTLLDGQPDNRLGLLLTAPRGGLWAYETFHTHYFTPIRAVMRDRGCRRRLTLHGLRHTAAVRLMESGVDIYTVSSNLGHKPGTTARLYGAFTGNLSRTASAALGTLVGARVV